MRNIKSPNSFYALLFVNGLYLTVMAGMFIVGAIRSSGVLFEYFLSQYLWMVMISLPLVAAVSFFLYRKAFEVKAKTVVQKIEITAETKLFDRPSTWWWLAALVTPIGMIVAYFLGEPLWNANDPGPCGANCWGIAHAAAGIYVLLVQASIVLGSILLSIGLFFTGRAKSLPVGHRKKNILYFLITVAVVLVMPFVLFWLMFVV